MAGYPSRVGGSPAGIPGLSEVLSQTGTAGAVRLPGRHSGVSAGETLGAEGGTPSVVGTHGPFSPLDREDAIYDKGRWLKGSRVRVGILRATVVSRCRDRHLGVS